MAVIGKKPLSPLAHEQNDVLPCPVTRFRSSGLGAPWQLTEWIQNGLVANSKLLLIADVKAKDLGSEI